MKTPIKVDLQRSITMNIRLLKIFQVWIFIPYPKNSYKFWFIFLFRAFMIPIVFIIPAVSQFLYVIKITRDGNIEVQEVASVINLVLTETLTSIKLLDLCLRRKVLKQLMDQLISEDFYCDETHKRILERGVEISRKLFVYILVGSAVDVFIHVVGVPALNHFKTLPVKMDMIFFDVEDPAYFDYVCAYQILYKPSIVITFVSVNTMSWAMMCMTNSQLDVLINKLENMKELVKITKAERNCDENVAYEAIFRSCALHHSAISRFVKTMQAAFGRQLFMNLLISSCIIGTTGVQILSIESPRKNITEVVWVLAYLSIFILNLFIDCYLGNAITHKSKIIPTLIFSSPWLNLSTKMKRNLMMFIAKTQQPLVLTTAKLAPVSIETFTKVMNWSYKGFAVINQTKK